MSEADLYMQDSNDSFDLPRWQTHTDHLSSSGQAAHSAQANYMYPGPPPPPQHSLSSPQRVQQVNQSHTGPSRQPRISQLMGQEQAMGPPPNQFTSGNTQAQLARSASLGGSTATSLASRVGTRRPNQPEDVEAYSPDNQAIPGPRQQPQMSQGGYYNPNVGYQSPSMTGTVAANTGAASTPDSYPDMYYNGSAAQPTKRLLDTSRGAVRSPHHTPGPANLMDHYTQQQAQYSPTAATYSYGPGPPIDQRSQSVAYQAHGRSNSQIKKEPSTPPLSNPYAPHQVSKPSGGYPMDVSTTPSITQTQALLNPHTPSLKHSISNPPTPMSYMHPGSHYYPQDQAMLVDAPPKRRAAGFRRVRTSHDLQPRMDISSSNRRMTSDGVYLSVSFL